MVEVFCTDVKNHKHAKLLLKQLLEAFPDYKINFDLDDRDNILRIESNSKEILVFQILKLLKKHGFNAQVFPDIIIGGEM